MNNKIIPTEDVKRRFKREIENFKLFSQYGEFKSLNTDRITNISYNPNAPNYSAEYKINDDDNNIKQLKIDSILSLIKILSYCSKEQVI